MRRISVVLFVGIASFVPAGSAGAQDVSKDVLTKMNERLASPLKPSSALPTVSDAKKFKSDKVYVYSGNTFHLREEISYQLLFDTPKAVVFRSRLYFIAKDNEFYFYRDEVFDRQWAFSVAPINSFAGHSVWSRKDATEPWNLRTCDAIMAESFPRGRNKSE